MAELTPIGRSRLAFTALLTALYLIAGDQTVTTGDPVLLYLYAPILAVVAVGHAPSKEALVRTTLSVASMVAASIVANVVHGRGVPDYQSLSSFFTAVTGLFALNLILIAATSRVLRSIWRSSDHWTR